MYGLLAGFSVTELLDYGCGHAGFAIAAARELGLNVHACDINADLIDELKGRHGENPDFFAVSGSKPRLALEDGQVSAVTCCDALEHMSAESRVTALREMRRVLADDGILVVTTPHKGLLSVADPQNVKYYFPRVHKLAYRLLKGREKYERRYGGQRHSGFSSGVQRHDHFSKGELSEMLTAAGFQVEEVRYYTLFYPLIKALLWFAESAVGRVYGARRLKALCWDLYFWDADFEPGRIASSIGIRARKSAG